MRHGVHGRKLGRPTPHGRALLRNLVLPSSSMKELPPQLRKLKRLHTFITLGKGGGATHTPGSYSAPKCSCRSKTL